MRSQSFYCVDGLYIVNNVCGIIQCMLVLFESMVYSRLYIYSIDIYSKVHLFNMLFLNTAAKLCGSWSFP